MKKLLFLVAALACAPFLIHAQTVEITPFGGYVFPSTLNATNGEVKFLGNAQYGGMLSIGVSRVMDVDLIYNRIDTEADVYAYGNYNNLFDAEVPLSINYMHIGFTKNFRVKPIVSPFVSFNLGACLMDPKESDNGNYQSAWYFSMGLDAGAKLYLSKRFGLRLQAQMLYPVQGAGMSMFVGTGGSGGGVSFYSTMIQFGFTGGLIFRLGNVQE